jgi:hypothetical protein
VNEDIKQFTLFVLNDSGNIERFTYLHSDQVKKDKKPVYYQLLLDNPKGQVLKVNRKMVRETHNGLPAADEKKILLVETEYFYFNKEKNKLSYIKINGSNIPDIVKIPEGDYSLRPADYDFTKETEIIRFFNNYFQATR